MRYSPERKEAVLEKWCRRTTGKALAVTIEPLLEGHLLIQCQPYML